jgi:hypothetical protein
MKTFKELTQLSEMPYQVIGSPDGKKEKKIGKPVKSKKYADARAAELADTHKKTGGKYRSEYTEEVELEEDSRRMSNKQHTKRVRQNIKSFGSNYTPPSNYDPDANRGKGEVLTRKQMEKKRRKALRQEETINERGDFWHPDPDKDRKLGGPGANQRAREDRAAASKPKSNPKKLRPGESYMDYAKRMKTRKESYDKPAERLKTDRDMFNIPKADQDAAKKRLLAKAAAKRAAKMKKESVEMTEDRAADAKASLDKVKARQKVLDAHEKKTGKKLDITKSPEHKAHKQNFPGAKRTGKKVKGAKETPLETHNRRVNKYSERLRKYGKTKKQDREDKAMAKHTSRFD